jgi:NodT family efflux transporter outer membrane factor (OMF) lipoprotein
VKWFGKVGVWGGVLLLFSCAAKAPDSEMASVSGGAPGSWSATKQAKRGVDEHWVRRFGDRKLNALVKEALANNHNMRIAAEKVYRAGEAAHIAGAASRPFSTIGMSAGKQQSNLLGFPAGPGASGPLQIRSQSHGVNLNISWEPDIWGRVRAGESAALAEWQAGGQQYRAARASLAAQVCKAWFALAEAKEQWTLAKEALEIRKKTEESVRERFEMNMLGQGGAASQLRLAQTDVATAKADLSSRLGMVDSATRQLELLVGRYPAAKLAGREKLPRSPSMPPAGLPSELLLRRPDIVSAERMYASSVKRVKEAKLAAFPSFKLTGSGGTNTDALSQILNSDFGVWSLGASATQYVLTGGQVRGEIRIRKSRQREALAQLHQTVLQAFGEVEQTLAAEQWLARREREMWDALVLSREAATAAADDYRDGNGDVLTLFVAQSRRIQLESRYVSLRYLRLTNQVDLHLALGGGFKN